jgi:hypothetical protein
MSSVGDPLVPIELVTTALAPMTLAFAAISAEARRSTWLAALAALVPFSMLVMLFDPASTVVWGLSEFRPGRNTLAWGIPRDGWNGIGRGPIAGVMLATAVITFVGTKSTLLRVASLALLLGGVGSTLLMPWNLGPYHLSSHSVMMTGAAVTVAVLAMHHADGQRRAAGIAGAGLAVGFAVLENQLVGADYSSSFLSGRPGRLFGLAVALAVMACVVWATDHRLSPANDELIGARMIAAVGALGCAFAGMLGAYVLWDLERHRFPRRVTAYVRLQHASIVMCTIGLGLALLTAITVFGGLLLALLTGLGAAFVGAIYILASVAGPLGGFESNDRPDPDTDWWWANNNAFVRVVQVLGFSIVHLFMVIITAGLWLLPPALAIGVHELVKWTRNSRSTEPRSESIVASTVLQPVTASLPLASRPPIGPDHQAST